MIINCWKEWTHVQNSEPIALESQDPKWQLIICSMHTGAQVHLGNLAYVSKLSCAMPYKFKE